jgi:HPt (histidine-containing phosphotransfer) domain-containing protein
MSNILTPIFDRTILQDNLGSFDNELLIGLYTQFLAQLAELSKAIGECDRSRNYKALPFYCHKLKASASAVGAFRLAECLSNLRASIAKDSAELQSMMTITELVINRTSSAVAAELNQLAAGSRHEA